MKAVVDLSEDDVLLIADLGTNADVIRDFMVAAATVMATSGEEQDAVTEMSNRILGGILILNRLRPMD